MVLLFVAALGATVLGLHARCRPAFVPDEDQGYFIIQVQAPDGASLEYTSNIAQAGRADRCAASPRSQRRSRSAGFSFAGAAPNRGIVFVQPEAVRRAARRRAVGAGDRRRGCAGRCSAASRGAMVDPVPAAADPAASARSAASSSSCSTRAGGPIENLAAATQQLVAQGQPDAGAARAVHARSPPTTRSSSSTSIASRRKSARTCRSARSPTRCRCSSGSQYVNDFDFNNRSYRVYVQADQQFRVEPERHCAQFYVRTATGEMMPLGNRGPRARDDGAAGHQPLQPVPLGGDQRRGGARASARARRCRRWQQLARAHAAARA